VLVVGPNGAGKTNLLEALHVGTQGFSPRTRADAQLVRFGAEAAVVKGGPAVRRAYFDRALGRLLPAQAALPSAYGEALGQRNASLRRIVLGFSARDALAPWTERVAELGLELAAARQRVLDLLQPGFAERAAELGLVGVRLEYRGEPVSLEALEARVDRDLDRGATGLGPHLDEIAIAAGERDLRMFGSQGEQRLAVLSLLLAEADLIAEKRPAPPLLLLDDVLSELDPVRREILAARVGVRGQTVITTTSRQALPVEPAQVVEVSPGRAA
jgi:DNA replication and repair protein RecF